MAAAPCVCGTKSEADQSFPALEDSNTVSWPSVFWPVAACTAAVMFQNAGSVCGAPYRLSYVLRASPLVCAVDTVMMLVKFLWMLILGCSPRTAARHVWYDRFLTGDALPEEYEDLAPEDWAETAHLRIQESQQKPPTMLVGGDDANAQESVDGSITTETYMMTGALPDPRLSSPPVNTPTNEEVGSTENSYRDEGIVNTALELTSLNSQATDIPVSCTASNEALADHDLEPGNTDSPFIFVKSYNNSHAGTSIDRTWRFSMDGFLIGALPKAIKVFAMQGINFTQVIVGIQVSSFVVPEIFRLAAGSVGAFELHPMPSIEFAKETLQFVQNWALFIFGSLSVPFMCAFGLGGLFYTAMSRFGGVPYFAGTLLVVAPCLACIIFQTRNGLLKLSAVKSLTDAITLPRGVTTASKKIVAALLGIIAVRASPDSTECVLGMCYILAVPITLAPSIYLYTQTNLSVILAFIMGIVGFPIYIYLPFAFLFKGSLSKVPRALSGLEGTQGELLRFGYVAVHAVGILSFYTTTETLYDPAGTYKPDWTNLLG